MSYTPEHEVILRSMRSAKPVPAMRFRLNLRQAVMLLDYLGFMERTLAELPARPWWKYPANRKLRRDCAEFAKVVFFAPNPLRDAVENLLDDAREVEFVVDDPDEVRAWMHAVGSKSLTGELRLEVPRQVAPAS